MSEDPFEGRDFYELMQQYRHSREWTDPTVAQAFEAVKEFARAVYRAPAYNYERSSPD